ncbi:MAG: hypothetical protein ACE14P_06655 [Methanotrichaceae archaeon]
MITLFAAPKPFKGHIGVIQRNAIHSWTLLQPKFEIILFGDEEGIGEVAAEYGLIHIPYVARNDFGTPLVSDMFRQAQDYALHDVMCYSNADVIYLSDFVNAVSCISSKMLKFLAIGQRWDLDIDKPIDFDSKWEEKLKGAAKQNGWLHPKGGMDYFIFSRGLFKNIPPFAIGRPIWDNWMVYNALHMGVNVIDATEAITAIHQNHDYSHIPYGDGSTYEGKEAELNRSMYNMKRHVFTMDDASYILSNNYFRPKILNGFVNPIRLRLIDPILRDY